MDFGPAVTQKVYIYIGDYLVVEYTLTNQPPSHYKDTGGSGSRASYGSSQN